MPTRRGEAGTLFGMPTFAQEPSSEFSQRYPEYSSTAPLDQVRARDFANIDREELVYLDYTGSGLVSSWQLHTHHSMITSSVFGNSHSANTPPRRSTAAVDRARQAVLEFFGACSDEYTVIFTPNATGALRLVGELYRYHSGYTVGPARRQSQLGAGDQAVYLRQGS